ICTGGRYHRLRLFIWAMYMRPLNTVPCLSVAVPPVTPVMAGVDDSVIDTQFSPSNICGASTPLNRYRNMPPGVDTMTSCHSSDCMPDTTGSPISPGIVTSYILPPEAANSLYDPSRSEYSTSVRTGAVNPVLRS